MKLITRIAHNTFIRKQEPTYKIVEETEETIEELEQERKRQIIPVSFIVKAA